MKRFITILLSLIGVFSYGQNILILDQIVKDLIVCDTGTIQYTFTSTFADNLDNVELKIALPQGVVYVQGTVSGAIEKNTLDPRVPIFEIQRLSKGRKVELLLDLALNCEARELIDMSVDFVDTLEIKHTSGEQSFRSSSHDIKTPHLVLTTSLPNIINIAPYQSVLRKHLIKNTKRGRLKRFRFLDNHSECNVRSLNGRELINTSTQLVIELGAEDFKKIGNGDIYFDRNEEITITEEIRYEKDCELTVLTFDIITEWGCDGDICQDQTGQVAAVVNEKYGKANLLITGEVNFPDCPCDKNSSRQCLLIKNNGTSIADSITLELDNGDRSGDNSALEGSFWYINSDGDSISLKVVSKETEYCESIYDKYVVELPSLEVGDSIKIYWYYALCSGLNGETEHHPFLLEWKPKVRFKDQCGDSFRESTISWQKSRLPDFRVTPFPQYKVTEHGEYFLFINEFKSDVLTQFTNGQLTLIYIVPCGYHLRDNDFKIEGNSPILIDSSSSLFFRVTYKLPFSSKLVRDTVFAKFDCTAPCLDSIDFVGYYKQNTSCPGQNDIFRAKTKSNICVVPLFSNCPFETSEDICGYLATGSGINHEVFCDTGDSLEVNIPGYVDFIGNVERISFGLKDDNNDRHADIPNTLANRNKIDLKSIIEQDTFRITLNGKVISDYPNVKYDSLYVAYAATDILFKRVANKISIFDNSEQKWYYCSSDSFDLDTGTIRPLCGQTIIERPAGRGTSIVFHPSYLKTRGCDIPDDFLFEKDDSIIVDMDFVFIADVSNYRNGSKATVGAGIFLYDNDFDHYAFSCGAFEEYLTMVKSTYKYTFVDKMNIQACKPSNADHYFKIIPNPGRESETNYFPYEYRNFMYLKDFEITMDKSITVDSFIVRYVYKDSVPKFDIEIDRIHVNPKRINDTTWTFENPLSMSFDDGYETIIEPFVSVKDCHILLHGLTSTVETATISTQNVQPYYYFDADGTFNRKRRGIFRKKVIGIKPLALDDFQQLVIVIAPTFNQSVDDKGRWSANVILDDSLKFFKFKIINVDPGLTNIRIEDDNGNIYFENNGEIRVNNYASNTIEGLTIIADNNSCELQHLDIISAWACDSVGDIFDMACAIDTFNLSVKSDTPRLDLAVNLFNSPFELCDTIDYIEIEITNADKGAAFDLVLDMMTSDGFNLLNNKILYATGDLSTYTSIPPPRVVSRNHYQWNLTEQITEYKENGFPGEGSKNHIIKIRIVGTLDCEFEPGSLFTFEIKAVNNCGKSTNSLKITEAIDIDGVSSNDNFIDIDAIANPAILLCTESASITVIYNTTENFGDTDELNISIPLGMKYVSGSLQAISNFNVLPPAITFKNGVQYLQWKAIDVSLGKTDISFKFDIIAELETLECETQLIDVKISHESNVYCKTSGDSCFVNLIAGMTAVPIVIDKGEVDLLDIKEISRIDDSTIHTCFTLLGKWGALSLWTDSLKFDLYDDHNNDGRTNDDHLICSASASVVIKRGDTTMVCLDFVGKLIDPTCHFIIELSNTDNCICDNSLINFDLPLIGGEKQYTLCPNERISIGTSLSAGQSYHWDGIDLPCVDCPSFEVRHEFNRDTSFTRTYVLTISDSFDCEYSWIYNITFLPKINLDLANFTICLGDSIVLSVEGVNSVVWSGLGIEDTHGSPATVYAKYSGNYKLSYVDTNGCVGSDSFDIIVNTVDTSNFRISNDTVILSGGQAQLWIEGEGTFVWQPEETLDCSDCSNPIATPDNTTTYEVTITDTMGCQVTLNVTVFVRSPPCDKLSLFVPNAFSPNNDGNNDALYVRGNNIDELHFMIYNRWGEKVFETRDITIPWDGSFRNKSLGPDVYSYYVKVLCIGGEEYVETGNVSILR